MCLKERSRSLNCSREWFSGQRVAPPNGYRHWLADQSEDKTWKVDVLLNGTPLLWAHAHVPPTDRSGSVDETCVSLDELARLPGGVQHLRQDGAKLEAVTVAATPGVVLRVQRRAAISSRPHRMGKDYDFPLSDLARALRAKSVREGPARVNLVLREPDPKAILVLNDKRLTREPEDLRPRDRELRILHSSPAREPIATLPSFLSLHASWNVGKGSRRIRPDVSGRRLCRGDVERCRFDGCAPGGRADDIYRWTSVLVPLGRKRP